MKRLTAFLGGCLLLWSIYPAQAAEALPGLATWKLTFPVQTREGEIKVTFLMLFSETDGKQMGDVLDSNLQVEPVIDAVLIKDDGLKFNIKLGGDNLSFDGKVTKDGKRVKGSFDLGGNLLQVELLPSKLKTLKEPFAVKRETLETLDDGPEFFAALGGVLEQAAAKKLKVEEVRAYTDRGAKAAEAYGTRFQRHIALKMAGSLVEQEPFVAIALEQARSAERMLNVTDDLETQMDVLSNLGRILKKGKKDDEVKKIDLQLAKLEIREYVEYAKKHPPFPPDEFKGRAEKKDQVVLVELFTGAECPPCVAVDLAFDALAKTYKPTEVIFMQYHLHIPGPDPLTVPDSEARAKFYGEKVRGTPSIFFNGKKEGSGGGPLNLAKRKYDAFRKEVDGYLEKNASLKLALTATAKGEEISIKANVSDLAKPGEKIVLRLALVEDRIRYAGGNGLKYHHSVVRSLPGGADGLKLTKATGEQTAVVKLDELRKSLEKYLDEYAKEEMATFPNKPLAMKNLRVIAFVQNDETGDVLQATQVDLAEKE